LLLLWLRTTPQGEWSWFDAISLHIVYNVSLELAINDYLLYKLGLLQIAFAANILV